MYREIRDLNNYKERAVWVINPFFEKRKGGMASEYRSLIRPVVTCYRRVFDFPNGTRGQPTETLCLSKRVIFIYIPHFTSTLICEDTDLLPRKYNSRPITRLLSFASLFFLSLIMILMYNH